MGLASVYGAVQIHNGTIAVDILVCEAIKEDVLIVLYLLVSTVAAITGLFISHARMRRAA